MIKNRKLFENFNKNYMKQRHYSYQQRLKLYEDLLKEAQYLKKIPLKNPLEGIDSCLKVARILNSLKYR